MEGKLILYNKKWKGHTLLLISSGSRADSKAKKTL